MRKHRPDFAIALLVLALMAISMIVIYAIGPRVAQFENSVSGSHMDEMYFPRHHIVSIGMSIAALLAGYFLSYDFVEKIGKKSLAIGFAMCVMVFILGKLGSSLVTCDLGACRAFRVPGLGFGFQPAELVKIGVLFYVPWLISDRRKRKLMDKSELWLPIGVILGCTAVFLALMLKDFGSTVVIFTMVFTMIWLGGVRLKHLMMLVGAGLIAAAGLIVVAPHRLARIASFNGDSNTYHIDNSLIGMGTGGLMGVGLGNSIQTTGYLPEALSDSIFSVIGEIWGFLGTMAIMAIYVVVLFRILDVSRKTEGGEKSLFAAGVFAWLVAHVIINVGGMTGIIPMKGITLPFLSYGGTSMMFIAYAMGAVLQLSGWTKREVIDEDSSSRRGKRRARNAGYRRS